MKAVRLSSITVVLALALALVMVAQACGLSVHFNGDSDGAVECKEFPLLNEAITVLNQDFIEPAKLEDDKSIEEGAINGLVHALNDPHTSFIDAETYAMEKHSFEGSFEGIGAEVGIEDDVPTIVAPIAGSPAEKAGILPGDKILAINGESTEMMGLAEAVSRIRGKAGTEVRLSILHPDESAPVEITLTRTRIDLESVFLTMLPGDIAHIRLTHFSERTAEEMEEALESMKEQGARALILDERNNPGGLLDEVVQVASQFLDNGVVLYEVDRDGNRTTRSVKEGGLATDIPMVVLVNQYSASGSEVVGGALQDTGRAPLFGTRTYGKGSVNHIRELSDGSALYITSERWLTPKGNLIEGKGLTPDVLVDRTQEDVKAERDPQLDKAIEYLETTFLGESSGARGVFPAVPLVLALPG